MSIYIRWVVSQGLDCNPPATTADATQPPHILCTRSFHCMLHSLFSISMLCIYTKYPQVYRRCFIITTDLIHASIPVPRQTQIGMRNWKITVYVQTIIELHTRMCVCVCGTVHLLFCQCFPVIWSLYADLSLKQNPIARLSLYICPIALKKNFHTLQNIDI